MLLAARKTRKSSNFKKAVTAIAKRTVMRTAETKTADVLQNSPFGVNGLKFDVWTNVAQGDGSNNRDGDEIRALGVKIRGQIGIDPAIITGAQDYNAVRMVVCLPKGRLLTTGDMPSFSGTIDPEKMTVLSDKYISFSTTKKATFFQRYIKFNRKVLYEGSAPNKNELYIWLIPLGGTGMTTTTGNYINVRHQLYWKDL